MRNNPSQRLKFFIDSNVILSSLISSEGSPRLLIDIATSNLSFIEFITGKYNLMEIEKNINKKFASSLPLYKEYLNKLQFTIIPLPDKEKVAVYKDLIHPKDAPVLASAIKGKAHYLVTGDKKDFKTEKLLKANLPVKIVSPAEALIIIEKELLRHPKKY